MKTSLFLLFFLIGFTPNTYTQNSNNDSIVSLYTMGETFEQFINRNELSSALLSAFDLLRSYPNEPYTYLSIMRTYNLMEDYAQVLEFGKKAINTLIISNLSERQRYFYYRIIGYIGMTNVLFANYSEAVRYLNEYFQEGYIDSDFLYFRSVANLELGNLELAFIDINRALDKEPLKSYYLAHLGNVHAKKGELKDALFYLNKAQRLDNKNPVYSYYLADAYYISLDYKSAIGYFTAYLSHPNFSGKTELHTYLSLNKLNECYFYNGDFKSSAAFFEQMVYDIDSEPTVWQFFFLIESQANLGNFSELLKAAELGNKNYPDEGYFDLAISRAYIGLQKNYDEATYHLNEALEKSTQTFDESQHLEHIAKTAFFAFGNMEIVEKAIAKGSLNATEKSRFTELKLNMAAASNSNPTVISFESIERNLQEVKQLSNELVAMFVNNKTKMAYYLALRGITSYLAGDFDAALKDIKVSITMHDYYEYYALRAIFLHAKLKSTKDLLTESDKKSVLDELDYSIRSSSESKKAELLYLKSMFYLIFGDKKNACNCAKNAQKNGAQLSNELIKRICKRKFKTVGIELGYSLSIYYDREL